MPRGRGTRKVQHARTVGDHFVDYLEERKMLRTWSRPQLKTEFDKFMVTYIGMKAGFSTVLFQLARFPPKQLRVHAGHIIFKGTPDYRKSVFKPDFENLSEEVFNIKTAIREELLQTPSKETLLKKGDIYGLEITCYPIEHENGFGCYVCEMEDTEEDYTMAVQNKGPYDLTLESCLFLRNSPAMALSDEFGCTLTHKPTPVIIKSKATYSITVMCKVLNQVGSYFGDVFFRFQNPIYPNQHFIVLRHLRCVRSNDIVKMLQPVAPFKRVRVKRDYTENLEVVFSDKIDVKEGNDLVMSRPLPKANVPSGVGSVVSRGILLGGTTHIVKSGDYEMKELIEAELTKENYIKKFLLLLQCEELQAKIDIQHYDLLGITVIKQGNHYLLQVPGLAEKRPSVLRGDSIFLRPLAAGDLPQGNLKYEGRVTGVELEHVKLSFHRSFHAIYLPGKKFNVSFTFNRLPLKLQYRAITELNMNILGNKLFPTAHRYDSITLPQQILRIYDRHVEKNEQQLQAVKSIVFKSNNTSPVKSIVFKSNNTSPYIIYGPPGTGKTITMVESIKQVLKLNPGYHILVCAPSNSACDLLVERLLNHVDAKKIFRMYAMSHNYRDCPEKIRDKDVANYNRLTGDYYYPSKSKLCGYNIIATTLITAGRLASAEFDRNHFDYIFIDEAGHAVEPECLIAIEGLLSQTGNVVLAGDPKQLGPILRSKISQTCGLVVSYLERLMDLDVYKPDHRLYYNSSVITKLINNYRSHKAILDVPNELFYENELIECADPISCKAYCDWEHLPLGAIENEFPLIFHGVEGEDKREANSPSYFNPAEASLVYDYLLKLLNTKRNKILPSEIGIIAPYRKQVQKIRQLLLEMKKKNAFALQNVDIRQIKVGSVEEFQGQERKVIIISTVRSRAEHLPQDEKFKLGFLRNHKRFNVAVTRAKALLIVIGNPHILCHDYHWKQFIKHIKDNGGYTGISIDIPDTSSDDEDDPVEECTRRANALGIEEAMEQLEISEVQQSIDPPWRNEH